MNFIRIFSILATILLLVQSCTLPPSIENTSSIVLSPKEKDKINTAYNIFLDRKKERIDTNVFTAILDSSYYQSPNKVLLQLQQ